MKLSPDDLKKAIATGIFVLVAAGILFYQLHDSAPAPAAVAAPVTAPAAASAKGPVVISVPPGNTVGRPAKNASTASAPLDPTLKMEAMLVTESLVYSGSGRNIFSTTSAPAVVIPAAIAPARPKGPVAPMVVQRPTGPPPPPPIDLKFFGTVTSKNGQRKALLLHGEDVFAAYDGDVVVRRYKVISIAANSIVMEDMTNNNRQTLPLQVH